MHCLEMLLRQLLERQTSLCVYGNNPAAPFSWHSWCTFRSDFLSNVPDINIFYSFTFFFTAILCLRKPVRGLGARRLLVTSIPLQGGQGCIRVHRAMLWCPWNSTDGSIGESTRGGNTGSKQKSAAIGFSWFEEERLLSDLQVWRTRIGNPVLEFIETLWTISWIIVRIWEKEDQRNSILKISFQNDFYFLKKYWVTGSSRLNKTVFPRSPVYLYLTIQWLISARRASHSPVRHLVRDRSKMKYYTQ